MPTDPRDYADKIADNVLAALGGVTPATPEQIRAAIAQGARGGYALGYGTGIAR